MKPILHALILALFLSMTASCASIFACKTDATYIVRADGTKEITYSSCKEQVGLDAVVDTKTGNFHVKVDKAGTQESVIAAALQSQIMMGEILKSLLPLVQKGAGVP